MAKRWTASVTIGDISYEGDERSEEAVAAASAARNAFMMLKLPGWEPRSSSNVQIVDKLHRFCQERGIELRFELKRKGIPKKNLSYADVSHALEDRPKKHYAGPRKNMSVVASSSKTLPKFSALKIANHTDDWISKLTSLGQKFDDIKVRDQGNEFTVIFRKLQPKSFKGSSKQQSAKLAYEWTVTQLTKPLSTMECIGIGIEGEPRMSWQKTADCCLKAAKQLSCNHLEPLHEDDVFAAIIMRKPEGTAKIISIGIGKGFIHGEYLDETGSSIIDCHAEVLARRGFEAFIMKAIHNKGDIVVKNGASYRLKEGITFHLYVSKVPCGNANLEPVDKDIHFRYRKEASQSGSGLIKAEAHTFDQLRSGADLYLMCCSAKIALWNVVGIQGALLSRVLEKPVYLSTIIVRGGNEASLKRAFCDRIAGCKGHFLINQPDIISLPDQSPQGAVKETPAVKKRAFSWISDTEDDGDLGGMVDTLTGLKTTGEIFISKKSLFHSWTSIMPGLTNYLQSKEAAKPYATAKKDFLKYCSDNGLGQWITVPEEVDKF